MADNMATPQQDFGLLTAPVAPPPMQQIPAMPGVGGMAQALMALGQLPQIMAQGKYNQQLQQYNTQMAQQNAKDNAARMEMQKIQLANAKTQAGMQMYNDLYNQMGGDPTKAADPAFIGRALKIQELTGVPVQFQKNDTGTQALDMNWMSPGKKWATMPVSERSDIYQKAIALPVDDRKTFLDDLGITGLPANLYTAKQNAPLPAGTETAIISGFNKQLTELSSGKLNPVQFAADVRGQSRILARVYGDDAVNNWLSQDFLTAKLPAYAQAQVDKLQALGISIRDADQLKKDIQAEKIREFNVTETRKTKEDQLRAQESAAKLQQAQQRLDQRYTALQIQMKSLANTTDFRRLAATHTLAQGVQSEYEKTEAQYDSVLKTYQSTLNAPNGTPSEELTNQLTSLRSRLDAMKPDLEYWNTLTETSATKLLGNTIGQPVTSVTTQPTATRLQSTSKSGKPIFSTDGGKTWQYQ
jgi:hypothetical protein